MATESFPKDQQEGFIRLALKGGKLQNYNFLVLCVDPSLIGPLITPYFNLMDTKIADIASKDDLKVMVNDFSSPMGIFTESGNSWHSPKFGVDTSFWEYCDRLEFEAPKAADIQARKRAVEAALVDKAEDVVFGSEKFQELEELETYIADFDPITKPLLLPLFARASLGVASSTDKMTVLYDHWLKAIESADLSQTEEQRANLSGVLDQAICEYVVLSGVLPTAKDLSSLYGFIKKADALPKPAGFEKTRVVLREAIQRWISKSLEKIQESPEKIQIEFMLDGLAADLPIEALLYIGEDLERVGETAKEFPEIIPNCTFLEMESKRQAIKGERGRYLQDEDFAATVRFHRYPEILKQTSLTVLAEYFKHIEADAEKWIVKKFVGQILRHRLHKDSVDASTFGVLLELQSAYLDFALGTPEDPFRNANLMNPDPFWDRELVGRRAEMLRALIDSDFQSWDEWKAFRDRMPEPARRAFYLKEGDREMVIKLLRQCQTAVELDEIWKSIIYPVFDFHILDILYHEDPIKSPILQAYLERKADFEARRN
jgi:hypothetical protein